MTARRKEILILVQKSPWARAYPGRIVTRIDDDTIINIGNQDKVIFAGARFY